MDLIMIDPKLKEPLYIQLYKYFKAEIEYNRLAEGVKLPSIRGLSNNLSISKITVEKAYQQLASEGYIQNYNRSRYAVNKLDSVVLSTTTIRSQPYPALKSKEEKVLYDFSSGEMDMDGFDFSLWKRYINKVFANKRRLIGYGNSSGEEELRAEIVKYIHHSRGVNVHKDQIIVGAGIQTLLHTLCSLLKIKYTNIAFEEPGFKNGRQIFTDHSFDIIPIRMNQGGIDMEELTNCGARLVYVSPSHQFPTGYIMPIGMRNRLLQWAEQVDGMIIEDDYDSEFRYFGRPIPALKGLDTNDHVVYLGSFSKIIPPSIRISYMVLPERLMDVYRKNAGLYNQAASTVEQLALAKYMEDGHLERQIRRLRKLYYEKRLLFFDAIKKILGDAAEVNESEAGLHTILVVKSELTAAELVSKALANGCKIAPVRDYYLEASNEKLPQIILYFSKIPSAEIAAAIHLLKTAWF
ncbi:putative HTH-type transcriptional regulator YdeL [Sporomusaceae bacterium FL31]|nr:putative HTH-type transcriptional regulator YdeL [Sporomusaceae bacterium FL31]GCE35384.1 putative HTH-type transcriptional regulator YdeL [Sporomusaceae bacterium]